MLTLASETLLSSDQVGQGVKEQPEFCREQGANDGQL